MRGIGSSREPRAVADVQHPFGRPDGIPVSAARRAFAGRAQAWRASHQYGDRRAAACSARTPAHANSRNIAAVGGNIRPPPARPISAQAVAAWCKQRYRLPDGFLDPERHVLPLAGSREGLFMAAQLCIPPEKNGRDCPPSLMPNPFYQVYFGAAVMNDAEPIFVAGEQGEWLPARLHRAAEGDLARAAMAYLMHARQSARHDRERHAPSRIDRPRARATTSS